MGPFITALLFSIGFGTWIYTKMARRVGYGNEKSAYITAGVVALIAFLVVFSVAAMIF